MTTVLIVEDDPINLRVFSKILTKRGGLQVKGTEIVEEVLQYAQSGEVDAILMDVSLANSIYNDKPIDGIAITKNQDWKNLCFDENVSVYGNLKSQASYRYTFSKDGKEIILDGDLGDELQITISDDLTAAGLGLDEHYFRIGFSKIS